ncbi:hypothetical protein BDZ45DRAFT_784875 [Acephala macrosclerotiorum]|nr:hypothetical protein BDZ45DRAFT_784875 [Acephala macrosclerotiorum]
MTYHYIKNYTTYLCITTPEKARTQWFKDSEDSFLSNNLTTSPFSLHTLNGWIEDGSAFRTRLVLDESRMAEYRDKEEAMWTLHSLSCAGHVLVEDIGNLEERIRFLREGYRCFEDGLWKIPGAGGALEDGGDVEVMLRFLFLKCRISRRLVANYKDRVKIRIDLDNRNNIKISRSMMTISIVTLLFLPGKFISYVFFNFQQSPGGQEEFQVSTDWWYYLVVTLPLTVIVFTVWIIWQKAQLSGKKELRSMGGRNLKGMSRKEEDPSLEMVKFV